MTTTTSTRPRNPVTQLLTSPLFVFFLRFSLAGLFIFSAWDKVLNPEAFAIAVRGYDLVPVQFSNLFALFVAWSEMIAAIMLLLGIFTRYAATAIFLLLLMFIVAITTTIVRGLTIDCGCFSNEGGSQTHYTLIIRNLFLMTGALIVILYDRDFLSLSMKLFKRN